jgi:hypothetical protein
MTMVDIATNGKSGASPSEPTPRTRKWTWIALAVVGVVAILIAGGLAYDYASSNVPGGPSSFAPGAFAMVKPGSVGCRSLTSEACYSFSVESSFVNLPISDLWFAVANNSASAYPVASTTPLGAGAQVTMLNATGSDGVWNMSTGKWSVTPVGMVSTTVPFSVVLDTGFQTNSTLVNAWFWVEHSQPYGGGVGFSLA